MSDGQLRLVAVEDATSIFDAARSFETQEEGVVLYTRRQKTPVGGLKPVEKGGIWFAAIIYPKQSVTTTPLLTLTTALSVVKGIARTTGLQPLMRWPSEVTLQGEVVAAASVELESVNDLMVRAFAGAGIHCGTASPSETYPSISHAYGYEVDEISLLKNVLEEFRELYETYKAGWRVELVDEVRDVLEYLRTPVAVTLPHGTQLIGVFEDLDELGRMSLRVDQERIMLAPAEVESITPL